MAVGVDWLMDERCCRHVVQVLRLRQGDQLIVFNEVYPGQYLAEIVATTKREARIKIIKALPGNEAPNLKIHVAQAVSRGERMDYAIQKSVELGVSDITPVLTERCGVKIDAERARKRLVHWRGVAISAAEQSGCCHVPTIHEVCRYQSWLSRVVADKKWVALPTSHNLPQRSSDAVASLAILIGPEGGLTDQEGQEAIDAGFDAVQLGPRVLRTETAPIVALTLAHYLWGDFSTSV